MRIRSIVLALLVLSAACSSDKSSNPGVQDTTPPVGVTDLAARLLASGRVHLTWSAPGDDATSGQATRYSLRSANAPITNATWESAAELTGLAAPQASGHLETFTTKPLPYGQWHFAIKATDESGNASALSNVASIDHVDTTPPSSVVDLEIVAASGDSVTLEWTAPGDDGASGRAAAYDLRRSLTSINEAAWDGLTSISLDFAPDTTGTKERVILTGYDLDETHFFALKSIDHSGLASGLSNVVNTTPARLVQITHSLRSVGAGRPDWSPDGTTILFHADWAELYRNALYFISPSGASLRRVPTDHWEEFDAVWSPDGARFVFVSDTGVGDNSRNLWIRERANVSQVNRIYTHPERNLKQPAWSPDGTRIAFVAYTTPPPDFTAEILLVSAEGGEAVQWSSGGTLNLSPAWSPDGSRIAFCSNRSGAFEVWVAPVDGGEPTQLTHEGGDYPDWSPDGTRIAFESERSGNGDLWIMDANGANPSQVTVDPMHEWSPTWSPDGTRLCFVRLDARQILDLWVIRLE